MSVGLPTLLALTGTALMAVAIFAPYRLPPPTPIEPVLRATEENAVPPAPEAGISATIAPASGPTWPALIEPAARSCDATARLDLIDGLRTIDSPWSREILIAARAEENDPAVRSAIAAALACGASSGRSLVT